MLNSAMNFFFVELEIEFQRFFDGASRACCFNFLEFKLTEVDLFYIFNIDRLFLFIMARGTIGVELNWWWAW